MARVWLTWISGLESTVVSHGMKGNRCLLWLYGNIPALQHCPQGSPWPGLRSVLQLQMWTGLRCVFQPRNLPYEPTLEPHERLSFFFRACPGVHPFLICFPTSETDWDGLTLPGAKGRSEIVSMCFPLCLFHQLPYPRSHFLPTSFANTLHSIFPVNEGTM